VAQVSFVAAGAQAANTNGSVTPALPAGITDGDLLLVVVATAAPARTFTAPAGWSTTTYATNSQANGPRLAFAWKSYVTGDTAPLMTAGGTGVAGSGVVGKVLAYRNADTTAGPTFGTAYSSGATTGTTTGTIGGVAVTGLGLALLIGVWDNSKSTTATAAGWTLDTDASGTAATVNVSWAVLEEAVSSSSSAGTAIVGHPTAAATMAGIQIGLNSTDGSGTVALTGGGVLSVSGVGNPDGSGTVALTGGGVLTVTGGAAGSGTVALTGGGTLTATGTGTTATAPVVVPKRAVEWSAFARGASYGLTRALPIMDAQIVVRHMGLDKALLTTPYTSGVWTDLQPGYGIAVYRTGRQVFSGPVSSRTLTWDPESGAATIRVEAVGDEVVLADRLAMPDPLRAADDQTVNDYWTYTGVASTAMRQLISDQAGATCAASRQVSGLTLGTDPGVGTSRTWQGLFDPVLDLLATMAAASGSDLGVRVASSTGALVATVVAPRNLVGTVIFSADLSNLAGFSFTETAPTVASALVAGQGDLHLRTRKAVVSSDTGTTRWARPAWSYVDRRDTNDLTVLTNAGTDALVKGQASVALAVTLIDSDAATYGTDWDLGDKVTVYVGLPEQTKVAQVNDVIREISFTVGADGSERIQPAIGSVDARTYLPTPQQRAITATAERVTALAKNK
jgi:hypothetical protein